MRARGRFSAKQLDEQVRTLRVLGVLALGIVLVALALWLAGVEMRGPERAAPTPVARPIDPLRAEFERCNRLGYAALEDDGCARAWAEHRRRFFAGER